MKKQAKIFLGLLIIISNTLYAQVPTITSFSPVSGQPEDVITITGTNFSPSISGNSVFFGCTRAIVSNATATSLTVKVPLGSTYAPLKVVNTASHLMGMSSQGFIVTSHCSGGTLSSSSFAAFESVPVQSDDITKFLAIDDLDGDGMIDLVVGDGGSLNLSNTPITIFRNKSQPSLFSFETGEVYKIDIGTYLLADLDNDGKKDIISIKQNNISILKNKSVPGDISFTPKVSVAGSMLASPGNTAVSDIDGDGKPDLVIAYSASDKVVILRNTSTASAFSFDAALVYTAGFNPTAPCLADIDGDGKLDMSVTNANDNNVSVFRNTSTTGAISFASKVNFTTGVNPQALYAADLNADGKQDLIVANKTSQTISFLENTSATGTISFASKSDFTTTNAPTKISVNDMDGDGKPDLVIANSSLNTAVDVFLNNSTGNSFSLETRQTVNTKSAPLYDMATGDLDGDKKIDIIECENGRLIDIYRNQINVPVVTSFTPTSAAPGATVTITGINFTGAANVRVGGIPVSSFTVVSPTSIEAQIGLGRTGFIDIITPCGITTNKSLLTVLSNVPKITAFVPDYGAAGSTVTITGINFNPDASKNIVSFGSIAAKIISGTTTQLVVEVPAGSTYLPISVMETASGLIALSDKQFTTTPTCINPLGATSFIDSRLTLSSRSYNPLNLYIDNTDIDGDGKSDLVMAANYSGTVIYRNVSNVGEFLFDSSTTCAATPTNANPWKIKSGDLDGDGKPDLVAVNKGTNTLTVYKNTSTPGHISFDPGVNFATGTTPINLALGDLNKDGKLDIVVTNISSISVLSNISDVRINFAAKIDYTGLSIPDYPVIGDIDGDQMPEVVVVNTSFTPSTFVIFPNTSTAGGTIALGTKKSFTALDMIKDFSVGDLDRDGKLDLIAALPKYISVYRNLSTAGTISLDNSQNFPVDPSELIRTISLIDFDADGKPEITASSNISTFVLKNTSNTGSISFADVMKYAISHDDCITINDFDGDGGFDIISPYSSYTNTSIRITRSASNSPVISYFTPTNATPGTTVTLAGVNFTSVTAVQFAGVSVSSFTIVSSTQITAVVGAVSNGITGDLTVVSACGKVVRSGYSSYQIPAIVSITPESGNIGETIVIKGNNFNSEFSKNIVFFGATRATVLSGDNNTLTLKVPSSGTFQSITVLDSITGLTASSKQPFVITNSCISIINSGSFGPKTDNTTVSNPVQVSVADFNNDGKSELLIANQGPSKAASILSLFKNKTVNNTLSFDPKIDLFGGRNNVICDINSDGKLDIVSTNSSDDLISIFVNTSSGDVISFAPKIDLAASVAPDLIAADDLDGDGKTDIIVTNSAQIISIYKNTSAAGVVLFAPRIDVNYGRVLAMITLSDLDGDGKPELIGLSNASAQKGIFVYKNISSIGMISFNTTATSISGGVNLGGVCFADLDKDGKKDVAFTTTDDNKLYIRKNASAYGVLSFATSISFSTAVYPGNVSANDMDGDGWVDLVVANFGTASVSVFKSVGGANLSFSKTDFTSGANPGSPFVSDLTGDGRPEIITVSQLTNIVSMFKNNVGIIAAPTTAAIQYCKDGEAKPLTASGMSLLWYTDVSGGIGSAVAPVPATTVSGTVSYYVSQTVSGCESPRAELLVKTNEEVLAPVVESPVNYCKNAVAGPLTATGNALLWYSYETDNTGSSDAPIPATNTAGTWSYFVSQRVSGCEGPRAQIDVVTLTTAIPPKPTVNTPVNYNQNDHATALSAVGTNLLWYSYLSGGNGVVQAPIPATITPETSTYYVTQTIDGCESLRTAIEVVVHGVSTDVHSGIYESIRIYPNPANSDNITIEITTDLINTEYSLMDQTGKLLLAGQLTEQHNSINIAQLTAGLYTIRIGSNGKGHFKLIKLK